MAHPSKPAGRDSRYGRHGAVVGAVERVIADIPPPATQPAGRPGDHAHAIARRAAKRAALLSGSLALPPGPLGFATLLPDLYLIWTTQRQMVSDMFGVYGMSAELTRSHMLYCLFRHAASHVLRDVAVRSGQRLVVRQLSGSVLRSALGDVGVAVTQRLAGSAAGRWIPLAGAAAVGAYAYWDTMQVAGSARRLLVSMPQDRVPQPIPA
ncbi:MAG TPA: hypothetical protein VGV08_01455 [Casimicrobiaceae bacterium]|nr:hypothetical protein [Casimicrobiaceae bacterium]